MDDERISLFDPLAVADIEALVEAKMREHQEPNGSYACDPSVMVAYVLWAIGESGALHSEAPAVAQTKVAEYAQQSEDLKRQTALRELAEWSTTDADLDWEHAERIDELGWGETPG